MRLFDRLVLRPLERRLLLSYVGAFAVVIVVFAIAVRLSFESIIQHQITTRIETLARAGTGVIDFTANGYIIDSHSFGGFVVNNVSEGLQWFDGDKRLKASQGHIPEGYVPPVLGWAVLKSGSSVLDTYTVVIADPRGTIRGYVRAGETVDAVQEGRSALDLGLAVGALLAIVAATIGGGLLASSAIAQREESFDRLREFTADASHELRTPLAALATTVGVALREPADPQTTTRRLAAIAALADQMNRLIDDLLILARAGRSLEREMFVVSLDGMLQRVFAVHGPVAMKKSLALYFERCPMIQVFGNPEQLDRILSNLVENAIRYTPAGGSVDVTCATDVATVRIAVRDNGVGISAEYRDRIFDRFWRGDNVRGTDGGSGLGLAIARALARRHGGDIVVASEPGHGSLFTLTLPRRPPSIE